MLIARGAARDTTACKGMSVLGLNGSHGLVSIRYQRSSQGSSNRNALQAGEYERIEIQSKGSPHDHYLENAAASNEARDRGTKRNGLGFIL